MSKLDEMKAEILKYDGAVKGDKSIAVNIGHLPDQSYIVFTHPDWCGFIEEESESDRIMKAVREVSR